MPAKQLLIFSFLTFLFVMPFSASAQPAQDGFLAPAAPSETGSPDLLDLQTRPPEAASSTVNPADIPDVLMAEMNEIESNCNANYMYSAFHDCRCIAVKFLDARLKSDPNRSKDLVFTAVSNQCPNTPGIAGYIYKSCTDVMKNERPDYNQLCECAANQVAASYTLNPVMNIRHIDNLRKRALVDCGIGNNPAYNSPYLQK